MSLPLFSLVPYTKVTYAVSTNSLQSYGANGLVSQSTPSVAGTITLQGLGSVTILNPDTADIWCNLPDPTGNDGARFIIGNASTSTTYQIRVVTGPGNFRDSQGNLVGNMYLPRGFGTYEYSCNGGVYQLAAYNIANVNGAAPLASPTLTGNPIAPTQTALTNNTTLATTAYADSAVGVEKTRALAAEALLAPLASPTLTGNPIAPTQTALTNNTRIATTAYADSAVGVEKTRALAAEALLAPQTSPNFQTGTLNQGYAAYNNMQPSGILNLQALFSSNSTIFTCEGANFGGQAEHTFVNTGFFRATPTKTAFQWLILTGTGAGNYNTLASIQNNGLFTVTGLASNGTVTISGGNIRNSSDPATYALQTNSVGYNQTATIANATTFNATAATCSVTIPSGIYGVYQIVVNCAGVGVSSTADNIQANLVTSTTRRISSEYFANSTAQSNINGTITYTYTSANTNVITLNIFTSLNNTGVLTYGALLSVTKIA